MQMAEARRTRKMIGKTAATRRSFTMLRPLSSEDERAIDWYAERQEAKGYSVVKITTDESVTVTAVPVGAK